MAVNSAHEKIKANTASIKASNSGKRASSKNAGAVRATIKTSNEGSKQNRIKVKNK
jgi:hypothetical protein